MERLDGVGPPSCVDGSIPGLGEVEDCVLLPGPGGAMEGGCPRCGHMVGVSGSIELPPPRG